MIKGWLDPVVAAKIHFTKNRQDLENFIHPSQIMKELEGDEDWEYKYVEVPENENPKMADKGNAGYPAGRVPKARQGDPGYHR